VIDTADIDVSSPKILSHKGNCRNRLHRDRPTVKIRSQALKNNPALREHNEKHEKSVGELLMEKFFIKDKKVDNDESQQKIRLYHQINLDHLEDSQEREAVQKRITRRFTRRRSSADLQLDPEQMQREAAYAQVQAEVLDSLVAEEQAQIENEARQGTLVFRKGTTARGPIIEHYANNVDFDTMTQAEEEASVTRIKKAMKKTKKKKRLSIDNLSLIDKSDNRLSSTSSEISTDSQIKENVESRSQMYKIEACNSAEDFSTIWMNTSVENERRKSTVKKFKENVKISVLKRFETENEMDLSSNDTDEAETQVVLAVPKPYIKDLSRNSVYLTMRKPPEKLNEKFEEIELNVKVDENQLSLTNGFANVENNILKNNASKILMDVDSAESNCKIQMASDITDFKALKKTVYESKNMKFTPKKSIYSTSKDDSCDKQDLVVSTKSDMQEIFPKDLKKAETAANPTQTNISAFISTNASKNDSQMKYLREIFDDTSITDIKNDENQKNYNAIDNASKKIFDYLGVDSTIETSKVLIKNSVVSVENDKLVTEKDKPKIPAMSHDADTIKQSVVETEVSDNVGKISVNGAMLTANNATCRLPKVSKINTDRNNAVEAPKLSLRETTEYLDSLKSNHDVIGTAIVLPEMKVNKISNLAQVSFFNASKETNSVDAYKPTNVTRHNDAVKLEAKETTLSKKINDKVHNNEYFEEAKLTTDIKPVEDIDLIILRNNAKRTSENVFSLKETDSKTEAKIIITEANTKVDTKEELLRTDMIKKIEKIGIDVEKESSRNLFQEPKNKMPTLLKDNVNESNVTNLSKIGKDSDALKVIKIGDSKSLFRNDANNETRILKKSISVDSSKLINDCSTNNVPNAFVDKKSTGKNISIKKKTSETKFLNKLTEKKPMKIDASCNFQDEDVVISRSTSIESIDFWSEIKASDSPETTRSKQQNGFPFCESTLTSKVEEKMNLTNSKWKDNEKKLEIDIKMNTVALESSTVESSNVDLEKKKKKEKVVSESLRAKKTEIAKLAKVTEIEKNMPTVQKIPKKKKNLSIMIDTKNMKTVKKTSLKCNDSGTATSATTPVEIAIPVINIVEAFKLSEESNRKITEEHEDPNTPTNELSPDFSLIKISKWSNQDDLTNTDDVETPIVSEKTSLAASPSVSPPQSSKTKYAIKEKKPSIIKTTQKEFRNNKLITTVNQQKTLTTKFVPENKQLAKISPKTSPKSSPRNTPLQRPLDLIKMFYTTPPALLTATPRDLSKVRRAKIKRRQHHSRTSISSDSTGSTTSTATTGSTDENGSTHIELDDDSEHKRMNSTRSNDSGFDSSPRISSTYFAIVCVSKFSHQINLDSFQIFF